MRFLGDVDESYQCVMVNPPTPCDHNQMVATGEMDHAWKCAKCGYIYGDQAEEEAIALGFPSARAAREHSAWLAKNGTPEYRAWLASISPNDKFRRADLLNSRFDSKL